MYCEKLSEQLTVVDNAGTSSTTSGTTTITGAAIDGSEYNRLIAYTKATGVTGLTAGTWNIQWQASVASTFGGTVTTITTCSGAIATTTLTGAVSTVGSCEISGEQVQSSRVAEDRYVRAIVHGISGSAHAVTVDLLALADAKRYHPN